MLVWEVLGPLVGEALISLSGPLLIQHLRERRLPIAQQQRLDLLQSGLESSSQTLALPLAAALDEAGYTPESNREILRFLNSFEGAALLRYAAMESIMNMRSSRRVKTMLSGEAAALMGLFFGEQASKYRGAAPILAGALRDLCVGIYRQIEKADKSAALAISHNAQQLRRQSKGLPEPGYLPRARTGALTSFSGSEIRLAIKEYALGLEESLRTLTIPTVQVDLRIPIEEVIVSRRIRAAAKSETGRSLLDTMLREARLVVLGDPGQGKSTLLIEAIHTLSRDLIEDPSSTVPLRLTLRHFARAVDSQYSTSIVEHLCHSINGTLGVRMDQRVIEYLLALGRCAIFIDGLDEVLSIASRGEIISRIEALAAHYPLNAFVVTSRTADYETLRLSEFFKEHLLEPFSARDSELFADRFFTHVRLGAERGGVGDFMQQTRALGDLRRNPLMLGVLCNLYASGRRMPSNRQDLYARCADMLFRDWDARKGIDLPIDDEINTERAVRELALQVFESGEEEFREGWLRNFLKRFHLELPGSNTTAATRFADSAMRLWRGRQWLIIKLGEDQGEAIYRFSHRTFLEYFASEQVVYNTHDGSMLFRYLSRFLIDGSASDFALLSAQSGFDSWRRGADEFLTALLHEVRVADRSSLKAERLLAFAANCLPFADRASPNVRLGVASALTDFLFDEAPRRLPEHSQRKMEGGILQVELNSAGVPSLITVAESDGVVHGPSGRHPVELFVYLRHIRLGEVADHIARFQTTSLSRIEGDATAALATLSESAFVLQEFAGRPLKALLAATISLTDLANAAAADSTDSALDVTSVKHVAALGFSISTEMLTAFPLSAMFEPVSRLGKTQNHLVCLAWLLLGSLYGWAWPPTQWVSLKSGTWTRFVLDSVRGGVRLQQASRPAMCLPAPLKSGAHELSPDERIVAVALLFEIARSTTGALDEFSEVPRSGVEAGVRDLFTLGLATHRSCQSEAFHVALTPIVPLATDRAALARFWGIKLYDPPSD